MKKTTKTKKCTECEKEFPKTLKYFFAKNIKQLNKKGKLKIYKSFRSVCKSCHGKKGNENRIKKRCQEMNCAIEEYHNKWKMQYSKTRTIDYDAKSKLVEGRYRVYLKMINEGRVTNVSEYLEESFKNKHSKPWLRKFDYGNKVYLSKDERVNKLNSYKIENITDNYIINKLGFKKGELPNEVIETSRLIIKLKREIKKNNTKTS